jgi:hypothetical protein
MPSLMLSALACCARGRACSRSIIVLRSAIAPEPGQLRPPAHDRRAEGSWSRRGAPARREADAPLGRHKPPGLRTPSGLNELSKRYESATSPPRHPRETGERTACTPRTGQRRLAPAQPSRNQVHAPPNRDACNVTKLLKADEEPMVELSGIEPLTSSLRTTRSPN